MKMSKINQVSNKISKQSSKQVKLSSHGNKKGHIMPFFIPMEGCPNQCIYCDQKSISGQSQAPAIADIQKALEADFPYPMEVAFYGGSFTALPLAKQEAYLQAVRPFVIEGKVSSLRISTRPDSLDAEICSLLHEYGVATVELGIQSFDDQVLRLSGRNYSRQKAVEACYFIQRQGFALGIQLMTGLPGDNRQKTLASIRQTGEINPDMVRIYPTVVLQNTPLAQLWQKGEYQPQSLLDAAELCSEMKAFFDYRQIKIIRMGLNPSDSIEKAYLDGPYHPAFGNMVLSNLKREQMKMLLQNIDEDDLLIGVSSREIPLAIGQNKVNKTFLDANYAHIGICGLDSLVDGSICLLKDDIIIKILDYYDFLLYYLDSIGLLMGNIDR
ncbi:MAG: radical SAM protein [Clostridiales bacterium]